MNVTRKWLVALGATALVLSVLDGVLPAQAIPQPEPTAQTVVTETASAISDTTQLYFVGDSITNMPNSFAYQWREQICGTVTACLNHVHVGVAGGSGACLTAACGDHPALVDDWDAKVLHADPKPTTVVVEIGVNDFFVPGITADKLAAAYTYLMTSGNAVGIRIILTTIPPTTSWWPWHDAHAALHDGIDGWLRAYFGAGNLLDIDTGLCVYGSSPEVADPYYYRLYGGDESRYDGLHPTEWGARCMAKWFDPARVI